MSSRIFIPSVRTISPGCGRLMVEQACYETRQIKQPRTSHQLRVSSLRTHSNFSDFCLFDCLGKSASSRSPSIKRERLRLSGWTIWLGSNKEFVQTKRVWRAYDKCLWSYSNRGCTKRTFTATKRIRSDVILLCARRLVTSLLLVGVLL